VRERVLARLLRCEVEPPPLRSRYSRRSGRAPLGGLLWRARALSRATTEDLTRRRGLTGSSQVLPDAVRLVLDRELRRVHATTTSSPRAKPVTTRRCQGSKVQRLGGEPARHSGERRHMQTRNEAFDPIRCVWRVLTSLLPSRARARAAVCQPARLGIGGSRSRSPRLPEGHGRGRGIRSPGCSGG